jgi:hypothetical protein
MFQDGVRAGPKFPVQPVLGKRGRPRARPGGRRERGRGPGGDLARRRLRPVRPGFRLTNGCAATRWTPCANWPSPTPYRRRRPGWRPSRSRRAGSGCAGFSPAASSTAKVSAGASRVPPPGNALSCRRGSNPPDGSATAIGTPARVRQPSNRHGTAGPQLATGHRIDQPCERSARAATSGARRDVGSAGAPGDVTRRRYRSSTAPHHPCEWLTANSAAHAYQANPDGRTGRCPLTGDCCRSVLSPPCGPSANPTGGS